MRNWLHRSNKGAGSALAIKRVSIFRAAQWTVLLGAVAVLARAQDSGIPVLTLEEAVQQAVANNSALKTASLETLRATDDLAAAKTRRFANTQIISFGAQLLTKPSVTFQQGSLGCTLRLVQFRGPIKRLTSRANQWVECMPLFCSRFQRSTACICN